MRDSAIEWTDHTFNPWIGCAKVSPGCANCYAAAQDAFRKWTPQGWGRGKPRKRTSAANWREPLKWDALAAADAGPGDYRSRPKVFCASLADWLDPEVELAWRHDLLNLIRACPNLDWLLLTKRPQFWRDMMEQAADCGSDVADSWADGRAPANVWIGATVEDQCRADERIPQLLEIPARVRFLSCEPLLEPVNLPLEYAEPLGATKPELPGIHWVICGGESGPKARPMQPEWARSLRDQCQAAEVPFFFKQWGGVNKKAAGCKLDGREWQEFPQEVQP